LVTGTLVAVLGVLALSGYMYHHKRDDLLRMQLADVRSARHQAAVPEQQAPPATQPPVPVAEVEPQPPAPPQPLSSSESRPLPDQTPPPASNTAPASVESTAEAQVAAAEPPPVSAVNIVRNDTRAKLAAALAAGYQSFHDGDPGAAQIHYARALQLDEHNRDAMLGLAAIAVKQGDSQRAAQMYRTLLRKNPRDSVAAAALSGLPDSGSIRTRESELKVLLQKNPRAAELHFALGTLYSNEQRWAEAQAAFFKAHKWDRENPDFMFNLAVSLDHLNKADAAEQYYAAALRAADNRAASFDLGAARERLRSLREARSAAG
ncbi:MAG: tetratricopeptide repeat protein, partial [Gammaproteobacteria bacterium]|nr:tetratricopeptide repeat protein [Gammaproteobacteria bacterium]